MSDFIEEHKKECPVQTMCHVLEMPRSTFYQSLNNTMSNREQENQKITKRMKKIHLESKERYGTPKIHHILCEEGYKVSIKRVQRLMKEAGIRSITKKKFRPTPSKEHVIERENIVKRNFTTTIINEKWVADITYIHTIKDGWCYLASVMDLHSKKIVGYSFARAMTTDLVERALENAYITQQPKKGLILHTDLGSQYTSDAFTERAKSFHMINPLAVKAVPMIMPIWNHFMPY